MYSVLTVLAEPHYGWVEALWRELKQRFGVGRPEATSLPHFSYHVASEYDVERLPAVMVETAVGSIASPKYTVPSRSKM